MSGWMCKDINELARIFTHRMTFFFCWQKNETTEHFSVSLISLSLSLHVCMCGVLRFSFFFCQGVHYYQTNHLHDTGKPIDRMRALACVQATGRTPLLYLNSYTILFVPLKMLLVSHLFFVFFFQLFLLRILC